MTSRELACHAVRRCDPAVSHRSSPKSKRECECRCRRGIPTSGVFVDSQVEGQPVSSGCLLHALPPPCCHQGLGEWQVSTSVTSSGGIRGTTNEDVASARVGDAIWDCDNTALHFFYVVFPRLQTFSPDARWLVTSSMDALVRTWDLPSGWCAPSSKSTSFSNAERV